MSCSTTCSPARNQIRKPAILFRRSAAGEEIDLVVEQRRRLLPIEVKTVRAVRTGDAKTLDAFCEEFGARAPFGLLVYDGTESFPLTKHAIAVGVGALLRDSSRS